MTIIRFVQFDIEASSTENITGLSKNRFPAYAEGYNNSFIDKIENNIGFIIIGITFVGALVWTLFMI
jgi:hypothetical protein